jgi:protein-disulfide isomerase
MPKRSVVIILGVVGVLFVVCACLAVGVGLAVYRSNFSGLTGLTAPVSGIQTAPPLTRPQVSRNSTGNPNAPVKMVEFSDFQCPFCKDWWQNSEPLLIARYVKTGKVFFTDRSAGNWVSGNIGNGGVESQNAAMAAYCAADENKFWQMHDALYSNVLGEEAGSFTPERLQTIAQDAGLDTNAFSSCFGSNKYLDQVNRDQKDAIAGGIQGTPFFILTYIPSGQTQAVTTTIDGDQPFAVFQGALDKALAAAGQ